MPCFAFLLVNFKVYSSEIVPVQVTKSSSSELWLKSSNAKKFTGTFLTGITDLLLVSTSGPPWEEIYTNDLERYESFEECERINQNLVKTYMENKINLIEVPKFSVKEKVNFINEFLSNE